MALSVNGAMVVKGRGSGTSVYLARGDKNTVARLNLDDAASLVENIAYTTRPFIQDKRDTKMRARRLVVWGEGEILEGVVRLVCDRVKVAEYPLTANSGDPTADILILQEWSSDMTGRVLWAEIEMDGTGIVIRDAQLQMTPLG